MRKQLNFKLSNIVRDTDHELLFHRDKNNVYYFDETALPNGGVYGMKERYTKDDTSKVTDWNLVLIRSSAEFDPRVKNIAEVAYKRRGRNNR